MIFSTPGECCAVFLLVVTSGREIATAEGAQGRGYFPKGHKRRPDWALSARIGNARVGFERLEPDGCLP